MPLIDLTFADGTRPLAVRRFSIREAVSAPFEIAIQAGAPRLDVDIGALVGKRAQLSVTSGVLLALHGGARRWSGVCSSVERVHAVPEGKGESTYALRIVPALWLLSQRRNHRIFQHQSVPEIAARLLAEWNIPRRFRIDPGLYPKLEYRVQYGETDLTFLSRMLEEAGIAYFFADDEGDGSVLVMSDAPQDAPSRGGIAHEDEPTPAAEREFVTAVRVSQEVRPGALVIRDFDFRRPGFPLFGAATKAEAPENRYEQYHYLPGAFAVEQPQPTSTPVADDKAVVRHSATAGAALAERMLLGERASRRRVTLRTNAIDLAPGVNFSIESYPGRELEGKNLLAVELTLAGTPGSTWEVEVVARFTEEPYRPPMQTPKPQIHGVQSAVVVGPPGREIHTDEFGRVRVQFPWDREGKSDDNSSCWMRVSHGAAGGSFGMIVLPRVGQEVLVGFLEGDPDQPIVVGRVFNATSPVPYQLPEEKTVAGWKGSSSPGGGGYNEIRFDDAAEGELFSMQAQKDLKKLVKNDEWETTLADRHINVKKDMNKVVEANENETTLGDHVVTVAQRRSTNIGGSEGHRVGGGQSVSVAGSSSHSTGENSAIQVGGSRSATVGGVDAIAAGMFTVGVGEDGATSITVQPAKITITTSVATVTLEGGNITLEAAGDVAIKAAGSVSIQGQKVDITGSGPVTIKGSVIDLNP